MLTPTIETITHTLTHSLTHALTHSLTTCSDKQDTGHLSMSRLACVACSPQQPFAASEGVAAPSFFSFNKTEIGETHPAGTPEELRTECEKIARCRHRLGVKIRYNHVDAWGGETAKAVQVVK